jgi:hypothetical protein
MFVPKSAQIVFRNLLLNSPTVSATPVLTDTELGKVSLLFWSARGWHVWISMSGEPITE